MWQRFLLEGQGLAYIHKRRLPVGTALFSGVRETASDALWLARRRQLGYWPSALAHRVVKYAALYWGYRQGATTEAEQNGGATPWL